MNKETIFVINGHEVKGYIDSGEEGDVMKITLPGVVALKIWQEEDIKTTLALEGFEPSVENVAEVELSRYLDGLNDCYEFEWETIARSIYDRKESLKRTEVIKEVTE